MNGRVIMECKKHIIPAVTFLLIYLLSYSSANAGLLEDVPPSSTVMVAFFNKKGAEDFVEYAENIFKGKLRENKLKIMNQEMTDKLKKDRLLWEAIRNANASAMAKLSTEFGADVLIRGNISVESNERFANSWEGIASLDVKAINTKTGEEIEVLSSEPMGSTENPAPMEDSSLASKQMAIKKTIDDILRKAGIATESVLSQISTISPVFYGTFQCGGGSVQDMTYSPDSRYIVGGCESAIKVWGIGESTLSGEIKDYRGKVTSLAFNKEGSLLAATTSTGDISLWNWPNREAIKVIKAHSRGAWAAAFSPDSRVLATGGGDGIVRLWEVATGEKIGEMGRHTDRIHSIAFDTNGRHVITASDDLTIRYWDINTKKEARAFAETTMDRLTTAAFSQDRSLIAYGAKTVEIDLMRNRRTDKRYIRLRDSVSGKDIFTFEGHSKDITSISFLPGRRFIVSSGLDKTINIWDVEKRGTVASLEQNDEVYATDASTDGKWLCAGGRNGTVTIWKLR